MTTSFGRATPLRLVFAEYAVALFDDATCAEAVPQLVPPNIAAASPAAATRQVCLRFASRTFLLQRLTAAEYHALYNRTVNSAPV
jgi:hypothetical protein